MLLKFEHCGDREREPGNGVIEPLDVPVVYGRVDVNGSPPNVLLFTTPARHLLVTFRVGCE